MNDAKWAVVCNSGNGETLSVNLFSKLNNAIVFMNNDALETRDDYKANAEYPDSIRTETYGEQVILFYGDEPELIWNVMPVDVH